MLTKRSGILSTPTAFCVFRDFSFLRTNVSEIGESSKGIWWGVVGWLTVQFITSLNLLDRVVATVQKKTVKFPSNLKWLNQRTRGRV